MQLVIGVWANLARIVSMLVKFCESSAIRTIPHSLYLYNSKCLEDISQLECALLCQDTSEIIGARSLLRYCFIRIMIYQYIYI